AGAALMGAPFGLRPVPPSGSELAGGGPARRSCLLAPLAVAFEVAREAPPQRAQDRVADEDRVAREREAGAELGLDLGVGPAGHVVRQALFDRVLEVHHP